MWHTIIYLFLIFSQFYIVSSQEDNDIIEEFGNLTLFKKGLMSFIDSLTVEKIFVSIALGFGYEYLLNACENKTAYFHCDYANQYSDLYGEPRKKIQIVDGFFGRNENTNCMPRKKGKIKKSKSSNCSLDITDFMENLYKYNYCNGLERCNYTSSNKFFGGDPCFQDPKYTTIHYRCVAPEETTTESTTKPPEEVVDGPTVCYLRTIRINCAEKKIKIKKVFFGRLDDTTCLPSMVKNYFGIKFNYKCDGSEAALKNTQQKCDGKSMCDLRSSIGIGKLTTSECNIAQVPYLQISHQCV